MTHWPRTRLILFISSILLSAGAFLAAVPVLGSRSASANHVLFGYSPQRLALAGVLILFAVFFGWLAFQVGQGTSLASRFSSALLGSEPAHRRLFWIALALCFLGWVGSSLPAYRVPEGLSDYLLRLRPLMLWLAGLGAGGFLLLLSARWSLGPRPALASPRALYAAGLALVVFLSIWLFILLTGLGLRIREDYWYGAGVPALPLQVFFSVAAGLLVGRLEASGRLQGRSRLDLLLFLVIWGAAAVLWAREPLRSTFFMPGPSIPNRDFYPFSDASLFDVGSQYALIGQGLFNGQYFDRVLYSAFLTYLHALAGQNFIQVAAVQSAVFAVFPAIVYLIGRELQGRALGVAAAVLIALRGVNSIAAVGWIDLASPKMTLTDFPTAILLALFTWLVMHWLKEPQREWRYAMWAGCALGLTIMVRTHALLLFPLIILFALLAYRFSWRAWLTGASLLALGMVLTTLPWDLRSQARGAPPFGVYFFRIYLVLKDRYNWWPFGNAAAPVAYGDSFVAVEPRGALPLLHTASLVRPALARCDGLLCSGVNHFLHNFVASVLSLPTSPSLDNLRETIKQAFPYWDQGWLGAGFSPLWAVFLAVNLALIALGLGRSWAERRWVGMVPLAVYVAYSLSNAFALTSGGRYVVPIDWIAFIYFLFGAVTVACWTCDLLYGGEVGQASDRAQDVPSTKVPSRHPLRAILVTGALILAIGSLVPLSELPFPERYASVQNRSQALSVLRKQGLLNTAGFDPAEIKRFLSSRDARVVAGRALYPRFYEARQGETSSDYPYLFLDYPRIALTLINPQGQRGVILPGKLPFNIPNASDVVVLGCQGAQHIDALAVFVLDDPAQAYTRWPEAPLECPVKQPVCVDKETCY